MLFISKLKLIICVLLFMGISNNMLIAKKNITIELKPLEGWTYEKIDFPLEFAPKIPFVGFEELCFSPGMFDIESDDYFSYIFLLALDGSKALKKQDLITFLYEYYKGLSISVGKSKKMSVDSSCTKVKIRKSKVSFFKGKSYTAEVNFFDTFTNGREIILNMELDLMFDSKNKKNYVVGYASPKNNQSSIWLILNSERKIYQHKFNTMIYNN